MGRSVFDSVHLARVRLASGLGTRPCRARIMVALTGVFITGTLSLMLPMAFYMTSGPLFFVCILVIVIGFGPKYSSKKLIGELPFQRA